MMPHPIFPVSMKSEEKSIGLAVSTKMPLLGCLFQKPRPLSILHQNLQLTSRSHFQRKPTLNGRRVRPEAKQPTMRHIVQEHRPE